MSSQSDENAADASISQADALEYWNSIDSTVNGMLGGFPQISHIDLKGSSAFLTKIRRQHKQTDPFARAVDCGAGIGRITSGLLVKFAEVVDVVEPVQKFTHEITQGETFAALRDSGKIGAVFNVGLEQWDPQRKYDLIWNQWCLGQLNDDQLRAYLGRCRENVTDDGWVIVKENTTNETDGEDLFDDVDSSVTRSDSKFRAIFAAAKLRVVAYEVQKGVPKSLNLYPVRIYALRPEG